MPNSNTRPPSTEPPPSDDVESLGNLRVEPQHQAAPSSAADHGGASRESRPDDLAELVANVRLNVRAAVGLLAGRPDDQASKAIDRLITAVRFLDVLERDLSGGT